MSRLLFLLLFGCVHLKHVEPQTRNIADAALTNVQITVFCGDKVPKSGHAVIISERHVLTAQHVVACAWIPFVRLSIGNDNYRLVVTREDEGADIARLELMSADRFNLNIPPPKLWPENRDATNEYACTWVRGTSKCGIVNMDPTMIDLVDGQPGDSGAGVYSQGRDVVRGVETDMYGYLLGIVTKKGEGYIRIAPVDASWLEGT